MGYSLICQCFYSRSLHYFLQRHALTFVIVRRASRKLRAVNQPSINLFGLKVNTAHSCHFVGRAAADEDGNGNGYRDDNDDNV